ncbi:amidase domain-containing protein [Paenibacillus shenyangensis]|uniref:amidase domain-containing protein n=1 Tax=Paenibacillus sp. A9 TaxID=1284352 RepID=UPI00036E43CB|nr:amidase domain-containing protein [Paenibacillus sp. A9]
MKKFISTTLSLSLLSIVSTSLAFAQPNASIQLQETPISERSAITVFNDTYTTVKSDTYALETETTVSNPESIFKERIKELNLDYKVGSSEYSKFVNNFLWDMDSKLANSPQHEELVEYAINYNETQAPVADPHASKSPNNFSITHNGPSIAASATASLSYNRQQAVNYAYKWAANGAVKRNGGFNEWGNDCTNFISQVWLAGGHFKRIPKGGPSGYEGMLYVTTKYWYSQLSGAGASRFSETSSWTAVDDFYTFWTSQGSAGSYYPHTQVSSLISKAQPGDIVQLSYTSGNKYDRTHSMVVTKKVGSTVYLTYHSGPNNKDVVDKSIKDSAFANRDFWLIKFD